MVLLETLKIVMTLFQIILIVKVYLPTYLDRWIETYSYLHDVHYIYPGPGTTVAMSTTSSDSKVLHSILFFV